MTPEQLKALQRYISATVHFMLHHAGGGGNILEYLASKKGLESAFGVELDHPHSTGTVPPPRDFPNIL